MKRRFALIFLIISDLCFAQAPTLKIYSWSEARFANPDTIQAISFEKMKLDSLPSELWKFTQLRYLNLDKNQLTDLPAEFALLQQLTELSISKNKLSFLPLVTCRLPHLRKLNASRNRIESIPNQIEFCSHLEELDFYDNLISDFGIGIFNLSELKTLNIEGVMYGTNFADDLKRKLPQTRILLDPPCKCLN